MTTTEVHYPAPLDKHFRQESLKSYIIEIDKKNDGPLLYASFGKVGRGAQGLGRKNRVFQIYIDRDNRAHAGLICKNKGGQFYRYVEFGTLKTSGEDV